MCGTNVEQGYCFDASTHSNASQWNLSKLSETQTRSEFVTLPCLTYDRRSNTKSLFNPGLFQYCYYVIFAALNMSLIKQSFPFRIKIFLPPKGQIFCGGAGSIRFPRKFSSTPQEKFKNGVCTVHVLSTIIDLIA